MHFPRSHDRWWVWTGLVLSLFATAWVVRQAVDDERALFKTDARMAHGLPSQATVQHDAILATVTACTANGYNVTATVVDRAGQVRAMQRADDAGPHTLEASRMKAFSSASAKNTTSAIMESAQKNPGAANLVHIPGFLLLGGGVPVKAGNEMIGALGVGGAPGGHLDEPCAMVALDKVKDQLK